MPNLEESLTTSLAGPGICVIAVEAYSVMGCWLKNGFQWRGSERRVVDGDERGWRRQGFRGLLKREKEARVCDGKVMKVIDGGTKGLLSEVAEIVRLTEAAVGVMMMMAAEGFVMVVEECEEDFGDGERVFGE
ncbi:unnamed protein product [Lathyrus oleraceus]